MFMVNNMIWWHTYTHITIVKLVNILSEKSTLLPPKADEHPIITLVDPKLRNPPTSEKQQNLVTWFGLIAVKRSHSCHGKTQLLFFDTTWPIWNTASLRNKWDPGLKEMRPDWKISFCNHFNKHGNDICDLIIPRLLPISVKSAPNHHF